MPFFTKNKSKSIQIEQVLFPMACLIMLFASACSPKLSNNLTSFPKNESTTNYANAQNWAAHPNQQDNADRVPITAFKDNQSNAQVDVFFLHPTTYTKKKINGAWNAPIDDVDLNTKTDETAILHQASIFNAAGRVFAPRYRQAHLDVFFSEKNTPLAEKALNLAYTDVKAAFLHYLKNENNGRPIIIAAHSQGTIHAGRLLKEFFDGKKLQKSLVAAYLVGMPIVDGYFDQIKVCESATETHCFCSWRTVKKGYIPKKYAIDNVVVTNPINWKTDNTYAGKELNEGTVLRKFDNDMRAGIVDAQIMDGFIWSNKPKFPWSFLITFRNYHIVDYNLFYANVRKNAIERSKNFMFRNK
jgi:hypothetical protein